MVIDKLIVLYGKANIGKSTTLNMLVDLLRTVSDSYEINKWSDSDSTFYFNGKTISVCTAGDKEENLKHNIEYFKDRECNIAITATRLKGFGKELLDDFAYKNRIKTLRIKKDDDLVSCKKYAAKIFGLISSDIKIEIEE